MTGQAFLIPTIFTVVSTSAMFALYFGLISILSGWSFALEEWSRYWPFVTALAVGFGLQVGIYIYLKMARERISRVAVVASGTTSGVAMVACCAHHLTNLLPILGASGLATLVTSRQVDLFWIGIIFNLTGLVYISRPIWAGRL